ncbi:D-alanine--D-alanine ligase [Dehalococcoides mccartyi]|uniref:D-alanine--D-alanine ligase family protein n=1 Tax=Dehalococcoides mccartyi TaxID=61435 RepID=UPI0009901A20|nr:ATP-grasp domain-containing protein [Dehalococcoides mccartyi]AQU05708.1 D-alanine--D-alanine ligase [Dehalococcoides mccartyi]AQU07154.1 D-alanine--D-alanine ligase [Dehalococcoides mccartyi]
MRIGLSYDLKLALTPVTGGPDDALEEYDSPETVEAITNALTAAGHAVYRLGGGKEFLRKVQEHKLDLVFNISEGLGNYRSREAQIPGVLEMLDIPYTGSDPQTLAICLDKPLTKKLVAGAGVKTAKWQLVSNCEELSTIDWSDFPLPAFLKPACEGSSKGVRFASRAESTDEIMRMATELLTTYNQPVLVEEFINGDEITVGVIGNDKPKVLGIMRIVPKTKADYFVYSIEIKRNWRQMVEYEVPAALPAKTLAHIEKATLDAYRVLECHDLCRMDFRVSPDGTPYFLEVNPLPGLNPVSGDLPIMASKLGISHADLVLEILNTAIARHNLVAADCLA